MLTKANTSKWSTSDFEWKLKWWNNLLLLLLNRYTNSSIYFFLGTELFISVNINSQQSNKFHLTTACSHRRISEELISYYWAVLRSFQGVKVETFLDDVFQNNSCSCCCTRSRSSSCVFLFSESFCLICSHPRPMFVIVSVVPSLLQKSVMTRQYRLIWLVHRVQQLVVCRLHKTNLLLLLLLLLLPLLL